jgi:pilus assembly protein Flp/PilA
VKIVSQFVRNESGATAIEYGLIAGLIGVVIIVAVKATGSKVAGSFNKVSAAL